MQEEIILDGRRYLATDFAAKKFGRSREYLMTLCRKGKVNGRRVGRVWYVEHASLVGFTEEQKLALENHYSRLSRKLALDRAVITPVQKTAHAQPIAPKGSFVLKNVKRASVILGCVLVIAVGMRVSSMQAISSDPSVASAMTPVGAIVQYIKDFFRPSAKPTLVEAKDAAPAQTINNTYNNTTTNNNYVTNNNTNNTTERIISTGVSEDVVNSKISQATDYFKTELARVGTQPTGNPSSGGFANVIAMSQRIDRLAGATIENSNWTGGTISGASISGSTLAVSGSATSTFAGGIEITGGCVSVNGACLGAGGGAGNPGGSDSQVQFNNGGVFEGSADFTFSTSSNRLTVTNFSTTNSSSSYSTSTTLFAENASTTNATSTSFFSVLGRFTSLFANAFDAVTATIANLAATELTATNATTTNATSTNLYAANLRLGTALGIASGGTGTSTAPAYGQLLLGNAAGGYDLVSTSSLGIIGAGGAGTWGSIAGTLSDQTDLQAALDAKLSFSNWYATTTDALAEGTTNKYWSNTLFDNRLAATTTLLNLTSIGTLTGLTVSGDTTLANATSTNFFTTTASSTNLFATNASFGSLSVSGVSTSTITGNLVVTGDFLPSADNTFSLGSASRMWKDVFIGPGSLYINGQKVIEESSSNIIVSADPGQNLVVQTSGTGDVELNPSGTGLLQIKGNVMVSAGKTFSTTNNAAVVFTDGIQGGNLGLTGNALTALNTTGTISLVASSTGGVYVPAGNFGIATTAPLAKFDVYGDAILSGASRYLNFGATSGSSGYGFRDNLGTLEFRNSAGTWTSIGDLALFSTTSASYFLTQNQGNAFSTTSANTFFASKSTTDLTEGSNLYFTNARADARVAAGTTTIRGMFSGTSPITFTAGTGAIGINTASGSQDGALSASDFTSFFGRVSTTSIDTLAELETLWGSINVLTETEIDASSELAAILTDETGTGNVVFSASPIFTGTATFTNLSATEATSTSLYATTLGLNSEYFTDFTGSGILNTSGALTLDRTGAWTGTFDGQEGSYYLANSFSTTSASLFLSLNQGNAFSTTSVAYWETQQTARTADDLTDNSIEDLSDVAAITENYGDLLAWNGTAWNDMATSSLGLPVFSDLTSYLTLAAWYATTTDALDEGTANLYFTNARGDARVAAGTTTIRGMLSGVSPITFTAGTGAIGINTASLSQDGALSAADFTSFYNRVSTTSIDTLAELETLWGSINVLTETEIDASSELAALLDDETGSGALVFAGSPTFTGTTILADASVSNATSTTLFSTTASSTNLFAQSASFGSITFTNTLGVASGGTGAASFPYGLVLSPGGTSALTNIATSSLGLLTTDVAEGSNLYFTNTRADARVAAASTTIRGMFSASSPLSFNAGTGDFSIQVASAAQAGYLAAADWTLFNNKVSTTSIDTLAELETLWGSINVLTETEIDASSELAALLDDETGTGALVFAGSPTFTGTATFASLLATASSTIGDGTQAGGLTIFGGATTTGSLVVQGTASSTFANGIDLASGCFAISGSCLTAGTGGSGGGQLLATYATSTPGSNVSVNFGGAAGSSPSYSGGVLTLPSNTSYVVVETWGAGGGGGGGSNSAGSSGAAGGSTCFGTNSTACTSSTLSATGGSGGIGGGLGTNGSAGGVGSGGDVNKGGGASSPPAMNNNSGNIFGIGGTGGSAPSGGGGGRGGSAAGGAGNAYGGGGGGGGASTPSAGNEGGAGGGAGGYSQKLINSPSGTYYYTVGSGGSAGAAGTNGAAGGTGGAGGVVISVYTTGISQGAIGAGDAGYLPFYTSGIASTSLSATSSIFLSTQGFVGISTTTPGSLFSLGGIANFTTATSTLYSSGGINLAGGCFAVNGACLSSGLSSSAIDTSAELAAILTDETGTGALVFAGSPTFTGTATFASILATASSTIGDGTQAGGLTIFGGATTTGALVVTGTSASSTFAGNVEIAGALKVGTGSIYLNGSATSTFSQGISLASGCFAISGSCLTAGTGGSGGGQLLATYATSTPGSNVSVNFGGAAGSSPSYSGGVLTLPSNASYVIVETWGGGGGGSDGDSNNLYSGTAGGTTCFGTNATACTTPLLQATGGGGAFLKASGGSGGSGSGGDVNLIGQAGGSTGGLNSGGAYLGGSGGSAPRGGGGGVERTAGNVFGGGGGGGFGTAVSGSGGGGGGYSQKLINSPSGTYYYTVGAGGTNTTNSGSSGRNGGAGGVVISVYTTGISQGAIGAGDAGYLPFYTSGIASTSLSATSSIFLSTQGFVGISTTTPGSLFSLGGIANFTTATSTLYSSGGINLAGGCFAMNGACLSSGLSSSAIDTSAELAAILTDETGTGALVFAGSPTFTGTATFASIFATASSTIGDGTQAGGLTIFGGATTTGSLVVQGAASSTFANGIDIASGCFAIGGTCLTAGAGGSGGGQLLATYATSTPGSNVSVNFGGAAGSSPSFSGSTLTLPSNTSYVVVETWGGGGGGGGSAAGGAGGTGGTTCFGTNATACTSASAAAAGGGGGTSAVGGAGGTATAGDIRITGGSGSATSLTPMGASVFYSGSAAGGSAAGGGGGGGYGVSYGSVGVAGSPYGGGGSGGGANAIAEGGNYAAGGGGGGGSYAKKLVTSPSGTYYYTVGSGGAGGTAGSTGGTGRLGGAGGAGGIVISVYTTGISNGSVASGTAGQFAYFDATGTNLSATSSIFLSTAGRVGIGTSTPWGKLAISTASQQDGNIPLFNVASTTNASIFNVLGNGYVGIGAASPSTNLEVNLGSGAGGIKLTDSDSNMLFHVRDGSSGATSNGILSVYGDGDVETIRLYGLSSGASYFNGGNVGIGTTTPVARLTVSNTSNQFFITDSDGSDTLTAGGTLFSSNGGIFSVQGANSAAVGSSYRLVLNQTNGAVGLGGNISNGSTLAGASMVIDSAGKVGIGTTTPGALLAVGGTGYFTGNVQVDGDINVASGKCFKVAGTCIGYVKTFAGIYSNSTASSNQTITMGTAATPRGAFTGSLVLPATTTEMVVEVWGAGGGGGGSTVAAPYQYPGGGGGGGGYSKEMIASPSGTYRYTIGAAGTAGTAGGTGGTGGLTCFGTDATACSTPLLYATGGSGGTFGSGGNASGGGTGGTGADGDLNASGGAGGPGVFTNSAGSTHTGGGAGGNAAFGGGGGAGGRTTAGSAGNGFGGGGGGGAVTSAGATNAGGAGGAGGIVITVYATSSPTATGNDYAELFPVSNPGINAGDIVAVDAGQQVSMKLAEKESRSLAGIISTDPGHLLGDLNTGSMRPVALAGRVPTKVNLEGGPIAVGDRIALSSVPGVGKKAGLFDASVGIALDNFSAATGTVMVFINIQEGLDIAVMADHLLAQWGMGDTHLQLTTSSASSASSTATTTADTFATSTNAFLNASASFRESLTRALSTFASVVEKGVRKLGDAVYAAVGVFEKIFAKEVHTDLICVSDDDGETCITKSQLDALIAGAAIADDPQPENSSVELSGAEETPTEETPEEGSAIEDIQPEVPSESGEVPTEEAPVVEEESTTEPETTADASDTPLEGEAPVPAEGS